MLALAFAVEDESAKIRKLLKKSNFCRIGNAEVYTYLLDGNLFYLFHTGIGKANAASSLSKITSIFSIDYVLNIGVAGGVNKDIRPADIVIAKQLAYFDVDLTLFNYHYGQLPGSPAKFSCNNILTDCCLTTLGNQSELNIMHGLITTGDQFVDQNNYAIIQKNFPDCLAVDMEAAALAQVCYNNKIHFASLKIISDLPTSGFEVKHYDQLVDEVTTKLAKFIPDVLKYFFYTKHHTVI